MTVLSETLPSLYRPQGGRNEVHEIPSVPDVKEVSHPPFIDLSSITLGAGITYFFNRNTNTWEIEELRSKKPGGGKGIIREFVRRIGPNQPVSASATIEPVTVSRLEEVGILRHVRNSQKPVTLTHPSPLLDSLKISRVLNGGGITINRMIIAPIPSHVHLDPNDGKYRVEISFLGTTEPLCQKLLL